MIKATYEKSTPNITQQSKAENTFPLKSRTRKQDLLSQFLFNTVLEALARVTREEKDKRHPNCKGGSKIMFADVMILYGVSRNLEQPKQSWEKKNKTAVLILPDFKTYYKANQNSVVLV